MRTDVHAVERCMDAAGMPETGSPLLSGWKVVDGIVDVTALVAGTAETTRILAEDKLVTVETTVPSLPVMIMTDPVMLRQIILNLLNNAIQFTERGKITIALKVIGSTLEVVVTDTGTGFRPNRLVDPADAMDRAGNAGSQVDAVLSPVLSVSKNFARLIGGSISARSVHGRGAMFTLTLPLRSAERRGGLYAVE
jgi:signal transduction histidine kinase